jgi:hypothetical protein
VALTASLILGGMNARRMCGRTTRWR